ncbi:hypothetical protein [Verrucomicrobium spinosum]|uniref:hypothetical protein n=1 Tax=Verrucomicrobium spinosum TaxID=2736 RepID=UPI0009466B90|nr:hypothetical protein [Verrucomicrobium spinosum]
MGYLLDGPADLGYETRYWDESYLNLEKLDRIKTMLNRSRHTDMLQQLAGAAIDHEKTFKTAKWHPKFVALMAWAATEGGEHAQALRLCERQPKPWRIATTSSTAAQSPCNAWETTPEPLRRCKTCGPAFPEALSPRDWHSGRPKVCTAWDVMAKPSWS